MKRTIFILFTLITLISNAQNVIEWDENYKLVLSDFQSSSSKIGGNIYSLNSGSRMDFSFYMSNYEFMFTKNFNEKVSNTFRKSSASLIAPDDSIADALVQFAQYEFDLSELYARKFRKNMYDKKGAFSDVGFFRPIYDQLQQEFVDRHATAASLTDIGREKALLIELQTQVMVEIKELADFCKTCKPLKKKK